MCWSRGALCGPLGVLPRHWRRAHGHTHTHTHTHSNVHIDTHTLYIYVNTKRTHTARHSGGSTTQAEVLSGLLLLQGLFSWITRGGWALLCVYVCVCL